VTIGTSLLVIAAGAILRYAVTATVAGVDVQTVGSILLVVGVVGLVIGLWLEISERDRAQSGPL
jgi:beta-lactamase regulating signal transducer with metallopeptidase domain